MFISFEGIDGSGKSTQIHLLKTRLENSGFEVSVLREPGGTPLSENIRSILLDKSQHIDPFAEMLLFSAARAQLVNEEIRPRLEAGNIVIADRFFDSTIAYQGAGRQLEDVDWLMEFQRKVTGGLVPDRTYLLRISTAEADARRMARSGGGPGDRMEEGGSAFFDRVVNAYDRLATEEPGRYRVLDGTRNVVVLHEEIWADFKKEGKAGVGTRV